VDPLYMWLGGHALQLRPAPGLVIDSQLNGVCARAAGVRALIGDAA
jgi:hypothetical protein